MSRRRVELLNGLVNILTVLLEREGMVALGVEMERGYWGLHPR